MKSNDKSEFKWAGISPFFHHPFVFNFIPHDLAGKTIVEGGCGKGIYGFLLRTTRDLSRTKLIGVDISKEYLDIAKRHRIYDKYVVSSLDKMAFAKKSIDVFFAIEVISHLTKKSGETFLDKVNGFTKQRSIIVCPNDMKHNQPEFTKTDSHISRWNVADFKGWGYKVYGFGFRVTPPTKSWQVKLYFALQYIFSPFTYFIPQLAGYLVAVKDFND